MQDTKNTGGLSTRFVSNSLHLPILYHLPINFQKSIFIGPIHVTVMVNTLCLFEL